MKHVHAEKVAKKLRHSEDDAGTRVALKNVYATLQKKFTPCRIKILVVHVPFVWSSESVFIPKHRKLSSRNFPKQ